MHSKCQIVYVSAQELHRIQEDARARDLLEQAACPDLKFEDLIAFKVRGALMIDAPASAFEDG